MLQGVCTHLLGRIFCVTDEEGPPSGTRSSRGSMVTGENRQHTDPRRFILLNELKPGSFNPEDRAPFRNGNFTKIP